MKIVKFRTKLTLFFLLGIAGCMVFMLICCSVMLLPVMKSRTKRQMQKNGVHCTKLYKEDPDALNDYIQEIYDSQMITVRVIREDGTISYPVDGTGTDRISKKNFLRLKQVIREYKNQPEAEYLVDSVDQSGVELIHYVLRLSPTEYLVMFRSVRGIQSYSQVVILFLLLSGLITAAFGALLWQLITRNMTNALEKMSQVTKSMSNLDFSQKINYQSNDEMGILSDSINHMSDQLEQSIAELKDELQMKNELLGNLSHEIKSPLTTIRGYTENIQYMTEPQSKIQRYCNVVLEECDALNQLAREMMDVSYIESHREYYMFSRLKAEDLFVDYQNRIEMEYEEERIEVEYEPGVITGNAILLERMVFNYIQNAVKYGRPDGRIILKGQQIGTFYTISVSSEGDPIPEDKQKNIWRAFYKGDTSRKRNNSYGIGLFIVKQVAEMHQAKVWVSCENGVNTFYFQFGEF